MSLDWIFSDAIAACSVGFQFHGVACVLSHKNKGLHQLAGKIPSYGLQNTPLRFTVFRKYLDLDEMCFAVLCFSVLQCCCVFLLLNHHISQPPAYFKPSKLQALIPIQCLVYLPTFANKQIN